MGAVERLVRGVRGDARTAREHVVPDHVHVRVAGVERLRRPALRASRPAIGFQITVNAGAALTASSPSTGGWPMPAQLRVDLTAVKDQVRAPERLPVRRRRMRRPLRAAVAPRRRVEIPRVVHLGHHPHVDLTAVGGDRLVERDEIRVAAAGRDPGRRHHLGAGAATVGADVDHRDRLQPGEELGERRSPAAALPPAEEELPHLRVLAGLALEAIGLARDPQERLVDGFAPASSGGHADGESKQEHEERERRPHELSIGRKKDGVYRSWPSGQSRLRGRGSRAGTDASRRAPAWRPARGWRRCAVGDRVVQRGHDRGQRSSLAQALVPTRRPPMRRDTRRAVQLASPRPSATAASGGR